MNHTYPTVFELVARILERIGDPADEDELHQLERRDGRLSEEATGRHRRAPWGGAHHRPWVVGSARKHRYRLMTTSGLDGDRVDVRGRFWGLARVDEERFALSQRSGEIVERPVRVLRGRS